MSQVLVAARKVQNLGGSRFKKEYKQLVIFGKKPHFVIFACVVHWNFQLLPESQ
jgi:hypothetical protein